MEAVKGFGNSLYTEETGKKEQIRKLMKKRGQFIAIFYRTGQMVLKSEKKEEGISEQFRKARSLKNVK